MSRIYSMARGIHFMKIQLVVIAFCLSTVAFAKSSGFESTTCTECVNRNSSHRESNLSSLNRDLIHPISAFIQANAFDEENPSGVFAEPFLPDLTRALNRTNPELASPNGTGGLTYDREEFMAQIEPGSMCSTVAQIQQMLAQNYTVKNVKMGETVLPKVPVKTYMVVQMPSNKNAAISICYVGEVPGGDPKNNQYQECQPTCLSAQRQRQGVTGI